MCSPSAQMARWKVEAEIDQNNLYKSMKEEMMDKNAINKKRKETAE